MIDDVLVFDNVIPKSRQLEIEEMCKNPMFKWTYGPGSIRDQDIYNYKFPVPDTAINTPQMYSNLYMDQENMSPESLWLLPVLTAIPFTIGHLIKIKINLTLPMAVNAPNSHGMVHTDFPNIPNNMTAIYYINDSDGDTVIFNEMFGHSGEITEKGRVSPKQGRLVVFDGRLLHAGNNPTTNEPRLIANINFIPYGDLKHGTT